MQVAGTYRQYVIIISNCIYVFDNETPSDIDRSDCADIEKPNFVCPKQKNNIMLINHILRVGYIQNTSHSMYVISKH